MLQSDAFCRGLVGQSGNPLVQSTAASPAKSTFLSTAWRYPWNLKYIFDTLFNVICAMVGEAEVVARGVERVEEGKVLLPFCLFMKYCIRILNIQYFYLS